MPKTKAHAGTNNFGRTTRRVMSAKGITDLNTAQKAAKEGLKSSRKHEARGRAGDAARKISKKKGGTPKSNYATKGK